MKIQILMSTYNGDQYIRTQLDSIVAQNIEEKELLIRDDGSTDGTVEIIQEYVKKNSWIQYYAGSNIGVQKSFFDLLRKADSNADYIAFADQDDEWLPDKLNRAIEILENKYQQSPALYCSDKIIVNEELEEVRVTVKRTVRKISFGNALVQNICTGCTAVVNHPLMQILQENIPQNLDRVIMHDWWLYLTASCFGKVYYDQDAYIRYRQHGSNASGAMVNQRRLACYRLKQLLKPRGEIYRQNELFLEVYKQKLLVPRYLEEYRLLEKILKGEKNLCGRIKIACDRRYFRQKYSDDVIFRGILILGKL